MKKMFLAILLAGGAFGLAACAQDTTISRAPSSGGTVVAGGKQPAPGGGAPDLTRQANGAITARYTNGCVVTYNKDGRRSGAQGCRDGQVERADTAVQHEAKERGGGGLKFAKTDSGAARVTFNDGCVVTYNKDGRRSGSQGCQPKQVARADKAAQQKW